LTHTVVINVKTS